MFTWICPQCGREVPPSYTECPDCVAKGVQAPPAAAVPPPVAPVQPPAPQAQTPAPPLPPQPVIPQPAPPQYAPRPVMRAASSGLPTWVLTLLFALVFVGLGAGIYC